MSSRTRSESRRRGAGHPGRIYQQGSMWYFHTRELMEQGPFHSLYEAESSLEDYVITMSSGYIPIDQSGEFEPLYSATRD
jgi:hypothetical protein